MRATAFLTLAITGFLLLSGCLSEDGLGSSNSRKLSGQGLKAQRLNVSADWAELALPSMQGHNHKDPSQHQDLSTPNFHLLGYDPLITDYYGRTAGDYGCGDSKEKDGRRLSVVHSFGTDIAFVIIDVTDPLKPTKLGEVVMANTQVYDLAISPNLKYVVLATSPFDVVPNVPSVPPIAADGQVRYGTFRDACTGEERALMGPETGLPYHAGNVLVDISNPRAPSVVDFIMYPVLGAHSVTITDVKGRMIVLSSVPNVPASYYVFMEISEVAGRGKLVPLSIYRFNPSGSPQGELGASMHDGIIAKHPGTGKYIAYLAFGATGLVLLDVEDPASPKFLSRWNDYGKVGDNAPQNAYVHEALPAPDLWEGRHYVWIGEECIGHPRRNPTCLVFGIDDTDPTKPQFVGAWTLPVDVQWSRGLEFSLHYLGLINRTLFATTYHGGVWAIDVSTEKARWEMPSIGVFLPSNVSPKKFDQVPRTPVVQQLYGSYALDGTPTVLDVNALSDGTLVVFDLQSGVYTVRFDDQAPAPSPEPWPLGHLKSG